MIYGETVKELYTDGGEFLCILQKQVSPN